MKEFKDEMNKKWGDLANSLGIVVEAIVAPGFPEMLKKYFGCENFDRIMVNVKVRKASDKNKIREFDLIAVCKEYVFLNETKTQVRKGNIEDFKRFLDSGEFFEYFPEYKDKTLIPIISSLRIEEHLIKELTKNRIFAVSLASSDLEILNHKKLSKYYPILENEK